MSKKEKVKDWFKRFGAGAAIGVAAAIPGVSGGTLAVILKVYEKLIDAVNNLFKHFVKSILYLLPILVGAVVALIPAFFLLDYALDGFVFGIVCLFAGFIIGSFPGIVDEVRGQKVTKGCIISLVVTCAVALALGILSVTLGEKINLQARFDNPEWWFYLVLIVAGAMASVALIVPGISGSMLMLITGFYKPLLETITNLMKDFLGDHFWIGVLELVFFLIGAIIGVLTIAKLMRWLLARFHNQTYYGIIGFIIGSTITLFFNHEIYSYYQVWASGSYIFMPMYLEIILGVLLLAIGVVGSYLLVKYQRKMKAAEPQVVESTNIESEKGE